MARLLVATSLQAVYAAAILIFSLHFVPTLALCMGLNLPMLENGSTATKIGFTTR